MSRPNKVGLNCHSDVRSFVRPQKASNFSEIWHVGRYDLHCVDSAVKLQSTNQHVGRGQRLIHNGMQYDPQGQGHESLKLEIRSFSKAISSAIYSGSWQLTTDS